MPAERKLPDGRYLAESLDTELRRRGSFQAVFASSDYPLLDIEFGEGVDPQDLRSYCVMYFLDKVHGLSFSSGTDAENATDLLKFFEEWRGEVASGEGSQDMVIRETVGVMDIGIVSEVASQNLNCCELKIKLGATDNDTILEKEVWSYVKKIADMASRIDSLPT